MSDDVTRHELDNIPYDDISCKVPLYLYLIEADNPIDTSFVVFAYGLDPGSQELFEVFFLIETKFPVGIEDALEAPRAFQVILTDHIPEHLHVRPS